MIYDTKPENFIPDIEVVSLMLLRDDEKFLLLKRLPHKPHGLTWGAPTGKVEKGENINQAIIRETQEETGLTVDENNLIYHYPLYVVVDETKIIYHLYSYKISLDTEIRLEVDAHAEYGWFNKDEALKINLIHDMDFVIKKFFNL